MQGSQGGPCSSGDPGRQSQAPVSPRPSRGTGRPQPPRSRPASYRRLRPTTLRRTLAGRKAAVCPRRSRPAPHRAGRSEPDVPRALKRLRGSPPARPPSPHPHGTAHAAAAPRDERRVPRRRPPAAPAPGDGCLSLRERIPQPPTPGTDAWAPGNASERERRECRVGDDRNVEPRASHRRTSNSPRLQEIPATKGEKALRPRRNHPPPEERHASCFGTLPQPEARRPPDNRKP